MRKLVLRVALAIVLIFTIALLSLLLWLRGEGFRNWISYRMDRELEKYNLCLKAEKFNLDLLQLQAEFNNVKIFVCKDEEPIFVARHMHVQMRPGKLKNFLEGKFELQDLAVDEPRVYIKFDAEGRSNLSGIKLPQTEEEEGKRLTSATMVFDNGQIYYDDQRIDLSGQFSQFALGARPGTGDNNQMSLLAEKSDLKYQGRPFQLEQLVARALVSKDRAEVQSLTLATSFGRATMSGELRDWRALNYDLHVYAKLDLNDLTGIFAPRQAVAGLAVLRGQVTGKGGDYRFQGQVESADLKAHGLRATGLNLKAEIAPGNDLYLLTGNLQLASAQYDRITIKTFHSPVRATRRSIELTGFEVGLLGGQARGTANIALGEGGPSRLNARLEALDLAAITDLFLKQPSRLAGKVAGQVELSWPGVNFAALRGQLAASLNGSTQPTERYPQAVPLTGELEGTLAGNSLAINRANFAGRSTTVSMSGAAGLQALKLRVKLDSQNFQEARQIAEQTGLIISPKEGSQLDAVGRVSFNGTVEGSTRSPSVKGQLFVEQLVSGKEEVGQFSGRVGYSPGELSIAEGVLAQKQGGRAEINVNTKLAEGGSTSASLRFQSFLLSQPAIQAIRNFTLQVGPLSFFYNALKDFNGEVNGEINLTGLPGAGDLRARVERDLKALFKRIEGRLDINIKNFNPQGNLHTLALRFAVRNEQIDFDRILLDLSSGTMAGTASYNTSTGDYKLDLGSDRIDLAGFSESLQKRGLPSGLISGRLNGTGNINRTGVFDLRIASPQITIGKTELREFELTSRAENGVANVNLKANYQGRPYQIAGRIRLSDNFPVEAEVALNDRSIVPIIGLFIDVPPRLEAIASGTLKIRGPLAPEEGISLREVKFIFDLEKLTLQVKPTEDEDIGYIASNQGQIVVEASASQIAFRNFSLKGDSTSFNVTGSIISGKPSMLDLRGQINLKLLNTLSRSLFVDGVANISATIGSSGVKGSAELKDVAVRYIGLPISLQEGSGNILFTSNRASIENFVAKSGSGQMRIDGGAVFENLRPTRYRFGLKANGIRVNYPQSVRSLIDGELVLQGGPGLQILTGSVNVRRAEYTEDIDLGNLLFGNAFTNLGGDIRFGSTLNLNVAVTAQDSIIMHNNLADVVGSASLKLTGPTNDPIISGRAIVSRGTLFLRNDRYNVTRGIIDFPETRTGRARFDVEAETELRGYQIILDVVGTLARFNTTLRSEPSLPQSDIIALLTTGQLPQPGVSSSALESQTRLGPAVTILSDILSERVEQRTGRLFGLNRFQIDPLLAGRGSDPTARITLGRRITKDLSLTYSTNVTTGQEQIVVIEYQINRNISVIGTRDQDGSYGFDVRFRKRF